MNTTFKNLNPREIAERVRTQLRKEREQLSRSYRNKQEARKAAAFALAPVIVDAIIDPDGTLDRKALDHPLEVKIPSWLLLPDEGETEYIYVQVSTKGDDDAEYRDVTWQDFDGPGDSSIFPYPMFIHQSDLPANGAVHVRYRHRNHAEQDAFSQSLKLICDRVPPWGQDVQPQGVQFDTLIIDKAYMDANPIGVAGVLPDDTYGAAGDTYELYLLDRWPEESDDYKDPVAEGTVPLGRQVLIPAGRFKPNEVGRYYAAYYLWDKATNKSRLSLPVILDVALGEPPANFKPPRVPLAETDNIIDLKDAIERVFVKIEAYDNVRDVDHIRVKWGNTLLQRKPVAGEQFPISIPVPPEVLRGEYTAAAGPQVTEVSYQILRGEVAYPATALAITVNVDFSIVGPERPDPDEKWPDPVNDRLAAPTIRGKMSQTDDVLTRADMNMSATLTFPRFDNIENGFIIDFYWNNVLVQNAQYEVDLNDPQPFSVEIPWDDIRKAGNNPALPVHYTVRAARDALNEQQSVVKEVNADAVELLLPQPSFEGITSGGWLNCGSLKDPDNPGGPLSLRVKIPDLSTDLNVNDVLKLYWDPFVGSNDSDPEVPVPGAAGDWEVKLDDTNLNGFIFHIEHYEDRLLPTFNTTNPRARARFRYAKADGSISSVWIKQKLSLAAGNDSCPLPTPRKS